MIQHEVDFPARRRVPPVESGQIVPETRAVLPATDDLNPFPSPTLRTAEDRHPAVHPDRCDPLLLADAMPLLGQVRVRLDMRLILIGGHFLTHSSPSQR